MSLTVRAARRSEAKPLIGLYAQSGAGKTYSALQLARGFVGPTGKIGMIETESGRGEAHVDSVPGGFEVISLREEFSPTTFGEALDLAAQSKWDALIVDSASHEWEGVGGVLSMAAKNEIDGKKGLQVWQTPKIHHQRYFTGKLLQTPIPLVIVCMRAKYPMEEGKDDRGRKTMVRSEHMEPKQSEDILFEMFVHGYIERDTHAFRGTKYTRPELADILVSGKPISIGTGEALAAWSRGDKPAPLEMSDALIDVLAIIAAANNADELKDAVKLTTKLTEAEKQEARKAFAKRQGELKQ